MIIENSRVWGAQTKKPAGKAGLGIRRFGWSASPSPRAHAVELVNGTPPMLSGDLNGDHRCSAYPGAAAVVNAQARSTGQDCSP